MEEHLNCSSILFLIDFTIQIVAMTKTALITAAYVFLISGTAFCQLVGSPAYDNVKQSADRKAKMAPLAVQQTAIDEAATSSQNHLTTLQPACLSKSSGMKMWQNDVIVLKKQAQAIRYRPTTNIILQQNAAE